jgi:HK97 family phage prohead protease
MDYKINQVEVLNTDEIKGEVEAIWATMGNLDSVGDIIHKGAFTKTFHERGSQVKLLDNHRQDSIMSSLGTVLELRELHGAEMPQKMLDANPEVTGGAWGRFQFLLDTPEGKGAFARIQKGAISQWSFGYDAVQKDHSTITSKDGKKVAVRNLRQVRLYEISPVLFPANDLTETVSAKSAPSEGKPYRAVENDSGKWEVYKLDAEGNPTGDSLGSHDTEEEAEAQIRALYAQEEDEEEDKATSLSQIVDDIHSAFSEQYNTPNAWDYWVREVFDDYVIACYSGIQGQTFYKINYSRDKNGIIQFAPRGDWEEGHYTFTTGPLETDPTPTSVSEAGPSEDDDTRLKQLIEIEIEETEVIFNA